MSAAGSGDGATATRRVRLRVSGIVQGVFFRAATRDRARALGLKGWVRNLVDGRVELVAEGPAAAVDELVRFCRRGPRGAVVDRVDRVDETPRGDLPPFEVRR